MSKCKYKIGEKFGSLTIIGYVTKKRSYECQCDCGKITYARGWALFTGRHKQCKICFNKVSGRHGLLPEYQAIKNTLYRNYELAAKRRNYDFTLSREEFIFLIEQPCFYCGMEYSLSGGYQERINYNHKDYVYNGVDRKNNNLGYALENCVSCCKICNNSKNTLNIEEWLSWVSKLYQFQFGRSTTIPTGSTLK